MGCCVFFRHEPIAYSKTLDREYLKRCLELDPKGKYLEADLDMLIGFALQGHVPPNLRRVAFEVANGTLTVYFYFDGLIQRNEQSLVDKTIAELTIEMASWSPSKGLAIVPTLIRLDYPEWLPKTYRAVYFRYEPNPETLSGGSQNDAVSS